MLLRIVFACTLLCACTTQADKVDYQGCIDSANILKTTLGCEYTECMMKKEGVLSEDGKMDRKKIELYFDMLNRMKFLSSAPMMVSEMCSEKNLAAMSNDTGCFALNMQTCIGAAVNSACTGWDDKDPICMEFGDKLKVCKPAILQNSN